MTLGDSSWELPQALGRRPRLQGTLHWAVSELEYGDSSAWDPAPELMTGGDPVQRGSWAPRPLASLLE